MLNGLLQIIIVVDNQRKIGLILAIVISEGLVLELVMNENDLIGTGK